MSPELIMFMQVGHKDTMIKTKKPRFVWTKRVLVECGYGYANPEI